MAKTFIIMNQKGGVGKSTTTSNLMASLSRRGKRVLGIDIDGQGHLTKFCKVNCNNENTILEMFLEEAVFSETVKQTQYGDLLPCDNDLNINLLKLAADPNFLFRFREIVSEVKSNYDFIFIDCPPAVNQVTAAALGASDYVIIPTEAELFSMDGVKEIAKTIEAAKKNINKNLRVLGLLLVKYNSRRQLTQELEVMLQNSAPKLLNTKIFKTKISNTVDVPMSQALYKSVYDYKPSSKAAKEYEALTEEILGEVK